MINAAFFFCLYKIEMTDILIKFQSRFMPRFNFVSLTTQNGILHYEACVSLDHFHLVQIFGIHRCVVYVTFCNLKPTFLMCQHKK